MRFYKNLFKKNMPGRINYYNLPERKKKEYLVLFYDLVSSLGKREEVKNFFKDLLSLSETVMIARRMKIALLLIEGKTYEEIRKEEGVGFGTIANVERWLHNGFGGYRKTIDDYKKKGKIKKEKVDWTKVPPLSFEYVRKKYPMHFLLCNAIARCKDRKTEGRKKEKKN